LCKERLG